MSKESKWKELIAEFRELGGIADNIQLKNGKLGRGVFPIDPAQPVRIQVPDNLLIDVKVLVFEEGKIKIKKDADVPDRERAFFEHFENDYSWGDGGERDCEQFFERVDKLPENVRQVLVNDLGLKGLGETNKGPLRVQRRFLRSRMMTYGEKHVLMPVLELVNHGVNGCSFSTKGGVSIAGTYDDEVYAHYGMVDPYGAFEVWGFASNEPVAFSLPATLSPGSRKLGILRQLSNKKVRGNFRVPVVNSDEDKVTISHLMLGHARFPRLAKGIFYQFMADIGETNAEELFDRIRRFNIQQFLKLMEALDEHEGPLISTLRRLCRHQISAVTNSVGTREL